MSKITQRAEMNEKITRKVENEIARLKIRIEEKDKYIDKLKTEYERIFNELKLYKKDTAKYDSSKSLTNSPMLGNDTQRDSNSVPKVPVEQNPYLL